MLAARGERVVVVACKQKTRKTRARALTRNDLKKDKRMLLAREEGRTASVNLLGRDLPPMTTTTTMCVCVL